MTDTLALAVPGYGGINAPAGIPTSGGAGLLSKISSNMFTIVLIVGVLIALFFLIFSGIQWILSGGDKTKIQAARMRLTYAIVGLVLLFLSFFIVNLVAYFFNIKLL